jgi:hypothetical protein
MNVGSSYREDAMSTCVSRSDLFNSPVRRRLLSLLATLAVISASGLAVGDPAAAAPGTAGVAHGDSGHRVWTKVLDAPAGAYPSEPHLAVDPGNPRRLFVVAQFGTTSSPLTQELLWRSVDGGRSWIRSPVLGGIDNSPQGSSGDPVVASAGGGRVLYATLTFDLTSRPGVAVENVATRVSTNGAATFTTTGIADQALVPLCFFDGSCQGPPPTGIVILDKPWLAVDTTAGRFHGRAYLSWVRFHVDDGRRELVVATSTDGGRSYAPPVVLDSSADAERAGMEELVQLAVRPDGTLDAVWNGLRRGQPVILHASSVNGGRSFSPAHVITHLRPNASRLGIVTSLAVSPGGRLALCWSQARSPDQYDAQVACTVTDRRGQWRERQAILPGNRDRQYLPAATFRGEQLWAAAYVSSATATQLVAVAWDRGHFGDPVTINRWRVPAQRICGPHPPDCLPGQTFIGDYIGLVAAGHRVVAAYAEPSARDGEPNRVLVSSIR